MVFILILLVVPLWAQEGDRGLKYSIEKRIFVPPKFYVGDQAELRLEINVQGNQKISAPATMVTTRWLRVDRIKVEDLGGGNYRVRIFFTSFQPGTQLLPRINLGGIELKNIQIYTSSVLKDTGDTQLGLFKGELFLPGTTYSILLFILVIIGVPVVLVLGYVYLKRFVRYTLFRVKSRRPFLYARVYLAKLNKNLERLGRKEFYSELSMVLKNYLSMKYRRKFDVLTTREMKDEIDRLINDVAINKEIIKLLDTSDRVKFQGISSTKEEMAKSLKIVNDIIKKIEEFAPIVEL